MAPQSPLHAPNNESAESTETHMAQVRSLSVQRALKALARSEAGLSLIEILIALTILGIAGTFITGKVFESLYEGQVKSAQIQMQNLAARLKEFKRHCGFYPTTEQGLESLVKKPGGRECKRYAPGGYIEGEKVPQDPWDNDFYYESTDGENFNITSFGADGQQGGEGHDKDIPLNEKNEKKVQN